MKCSRCKIYKGIFGWSYKYNRICFKCYNILMEERIELQKSAKEIKKGVNNISK